MFNQYLIFMFLYVSIFSIYEIFNNKDYIKALKSKDSKKAEIIFYLLLHNIIYVAIYFSLFFIIYNIKTIHINYLYLYLILLISIPTHWIMNNNQCWFTVKQNKLLGIKLDTGFRDFVSIIMNIDTESKTDQFNIRDKIYYGYLIAATIITILLIFFKLKKN